MLLAYAVASTARAGIWDESPGVAILAVVALVYFSWPYRFPTCAKWHDLTVVAFYASKQVGNTIEEA